MGWLNNQIAAILGLEAPTAESVGDILLVWVAPTVIGVAIIWVCIWLWTRWGSKQQHANNDTLTPTPESPSKVRSPGKLQRISLADLKEAAAKSGWDFGQQSVELLDFGDAIRQAGLDGVLKIWGRLPQSIPELTRREPLVEIPKDHWAKFQIDVIPLGSGRENMEVGTYNPRIIPWGKGYVDLHFEQASALDWTKNDAKGFIGQNSKIAQDWLVLRDVVHWLANNTRLADGYDVIELYQALRQAAVARHVDIRGFKEINRHMPWERFDTVRTKIPADYWGDYEFELTVSSDPSAPNDKPETVLAGGGQGGALFYNGLQADMNQVKKHFG